MDKNIIKEVIKEMIIDGELKFKLDRGVYEAESPSGVYIKKIPTINLKVLDENDSELSIACTLLEDIVWDIELGNLNNNLFKQGK